MPAGRAGSGSIEGGEAASRRPDAPAGKRPGQTASLMPGEEKTGGAARLGGKPKTPGDERHLDLDLSQGGDEGPALQSFFQGPGRVQRIARLDDEKKGWVETEGEQARTVRGAPFARGSLHQAPQYGRGTVSPGQTLAEKGQGKGECCRLIAVSGSPDLVQSARRKLAQGRCFLPRKGGGVRRHDAGREKKGAGGAGKARARCGGKGQRHGNLLERSDTPAQALDQTFAPCPACSLNARRRKLTDVFTTWNVVTHGTKLRISFLFCSNESRNESQGD